MFEDVTYSYYTNTLKRGVIPSAADFDRLAPENILHIKKILPFLREREKGGIDAACCMCIEEQYRGETGGLEVTSESIGGFSQSFDVSGIKRLEQKKRKWIDLYLEVYTGVM